MSRIIKLENIADFNASAINKHDSFSEINYLDTGSITRNVIDSYQNLKVGIDGIPSRAKRKVKDKTIIYSTVRPNQEHFGFMVNPLDNLIVSTGFCTIDINDDGIDPKYIYYLITQPHITVYLHTIGMNSVSAYPSINPSDIANLNFQIPEFEEQQKIASVLSTLDEKIALNNQINATLEQMAKTLYDYWFVQFDFPDDNGKPYKSSGGEMVYNETLKRDIPKGWGVKQLNQLITVKDGTHNSPRYVENGYPLVTSKNLFSSGIDFSNTNKISASDFIEINKRSKVDNGDILFSMIGNIGTIYKVEETDINFAIKNVALFKSSENLELKNYFFQYFHSHDMQSYMRSVISGSIQKFIGLESLRKTPILFGSGLKSMLK